MKLQMIYFCVSHGRKLTERPLCLSAVSIDSKLLFSESDLGSSIQYTILSMRCCLNGRVCLSCNYKKNVFLRFRIFKILQHAVTECRLL